MSEELKANAIVVIVVEDEPLIRFVLTEALKEDGIEVIEATHAAEAIAVLEAEAARVHALVTDVHMPGELDGVELAFYVKARWPWLSLLVTSGRASPTPKAMPEGARFVPKPYNLRHVVHHIREMRATI